MKVLTVIPSLDARAGGPATVVCQMVDCLRREGVSVWLVSTLPGSNLKASISEYPGAETVLFPTRFGGCFAFSLKLLSWLKEHLGEFDLVHVHSVMTWASFLTMRLCREKKIPFIVSTHGILDDYGFRQKRIKKWLFFHGFEKSLLRQAKSIHCASEYERDQLLRYFSTSQLAVIPFGTNISGQRESPKEKAEEKNSVTAKCSVVYLGRISKKKGVDILLKAASGLAGKRHDFRLTICGDVKSRYGRKLIRLSHQLHLGPICSFRGFVGEDEKKKILSDSDIFVLASQDENFGVAVLEAMAFGVPVIVSPKVALSAEVISARAGLVDVATPAELGLALEFLLDHREVRQDMGARGRALVEAQFRWSKIVPAYVRLYQNALRCSTVASGT